MLIPLMGIFVSAALWSQWFSIPGFTDPEQSPSKRLFGSLQMTWDCASLYILIKQELPYYDHLTTKPNNHPDGSPDDTPKVPPVTLADMFDNTTITEVWAINSGAKAAFPAPEETIPPHPPMFPWTRGMFASSANQSTDGIVPPLFSPKRLAFIEWPILFLFLFVPNFIHHVLVTVIPSVIGLYFGLYGLYCYLSLALCPVIFVISQLKLCCDAARLLVYLHIEGPPRLARVQFVADRNLSMHEITDLLIAGSNAATHNIDTDSANFLVSALLQAEDNLSYRLALKFILATEDETTNAWKAKQSVEAALDANHVRLVTLVAQGTEPPSPDHYSARVPVLMPWQPRSLPLFMVSHLVGIYLTPWQEEPLVTEVRSEMDDVDTEDLDLVK